MEDSAKKLHAVILGKKNKTLLAKVKEFVLSLENREVFKYTNGLFIHHIHPVDPALLKKEINAILNDWTANFGIPNYLQNRFNDYVETTQGNPPPLDVVCLLLECASGRKYGIDNKSETGVLLGALFSSATAGSFNLLTFSSWERKPPRDLG